MVWRSILHAHLFNCRFGPVVEFHTIMPTGLGTRCFDIIMQCYSDTENRYSDQLGLSRHSLFKVCMVLPCTDESESNLFNIGKHLHTILKLKKPLYYRPKKQCSGSISGTMETTTGSTTGSTTTDSSTTIHPAETEIKLTELQHEYYSEYRIVREEIKSASSFAEENKKVSILGYQPTKSITYVLEKKKRVGSTQVTTWSSTTVQG